MDIADLEDLLPLLLPGLEISKRINTPSGQRIVYFGQFSESATPEKSQWGEVAIKIARHINIKLLTRLQKEIHILRSLKSEFYPTLFHDEAFTHLPEQEEELATPIYVTVEERVDSAPLNECMEKFADEKTALQLMINLVDGLSLLWKRKERLVHRDLKPENILIRPSGLPVIIDLGLLREEGTVGITSDGLPFGPCTPPYASPEQVKNDKIAISFRSDFFSLGIILYQLLSGFNPFFCNNETHYSDIFENILNHYPTRLDVLGRASKETSDLVQKLLSKEPYQRYRTVDAFAAELKNIKEHLK